jgi:hypothetical protein
MSLWPRGLRFLVVLSLAGVGPAAWAAPVAVLAQEDPSDREPPGMAEPGPATDDVMSAPEAEPAEPEMASEGD